MTKNWAMYKEKVEENLREKYTVTIEKEEDNNKLWKKREEDNSNMRWCSAQALYRKVDLKM
jgi:hypothetical protein